MASLAASWPPPGVFVQASLTICVLKSVRLHGTALSSPADAVSDAMPSARTIEAMEAKIPSLLMMVFLYDGRAEGTIHLGPHGAHPATSRIPSASAAATMSDAWFTAEMAQIAAAPAA